MSFIPRVTCRRCGRQFSGMRGRCPYCGTRRVRQSERVPGPTPGEDMSTPSGQRAAVNARWQLIFGAILLVAVILAVVVLISMSLNSGGVTIYYGSEPLGDDVTISAPLTATASIWPMTVEIPAEAIVWESSDPNVVKVEVSADDPTRCTLTGVGSGSCNVTVTVYGASDTAIVRYVG